jgi:flagellar biosynthetic protein FlhB
MAGPILLAAVLAGYLANVMQIGFLVTSETLKLDINRINPISGFQRIFSKRSIAELLKSIFKTVLVSYVAFSYLWKQFPGFSVMMDTPIETSFSFIGEVTFNTGWRILVVLFVLAIADYGFQLYEYEQSLKMSKQEIKEEYKNIEGDPQLKSKIRERQRQMASRRMMQEVPKATVIITNPTHFSIALKYADTINAPLVLAKGADLIAKKIIEIAKENNIVIVENKPLARLLFSKAEIGTTIPGDLYQAVAEVLAYVYRLKKHF